MQDHEIKIATQTELQARLVDISDRMDNLECRPSNFQEHANLAREMDAINDELEGRLIVAENEG